MFKFPDKKKGEFIDADHINALSDVAKYVQSLGPGSNINSNAGMMSVPVAFIQRTLIITRVRVEDDTFSSDSSISSSSQSSYSISGSSSSSGSQSSSDWPCPDALYEAVPRYFDFDSKTWKTSDEEPYCLDASEFGDGLAVGDIVQAWFDTQRGMFVGGDQGVLIGKCPNNIGKGGFGTVHIYRGSSKGSETHRPGDKVRAYARGMSITKGLWVYVQKIYGGYEVVPCECPP